MFLAAAVALAACSHDEVSSSDAQPGLNPADYRCRMDLGDGTCISEPANCPASIPHDQTPRCASGEVLIKKEDDHCEHMFICED